MTYIDFLDIIHEWFKSLILDNMSVTNLVLENSIGESV